MYGTQDKQEVGQRLQHLDLILPDLVQRLPRLKADLLLELLSNTEVRQAQTLHVLDFLVVMQ